MCIGLVFDRDEFLNLVASFLILRTSSSVHLPPCPEHQDRPSKTPGLGLDAAWFCLDSFHESVFHRRLKPSLVFSFASGIPICQWGRKRGKCKRREGSTQATGNHSNAGGLSKCRRHRVLDCLNKCFSFSAFPL